MKIVSVVVTKDSVTVYDEKCKNYTYHQGTPEIKYLKEKVLPVFNEVGYAYFDPTLPENIYSTFESKSKVVKFFLMSIEKLKTYFKQDSSGQFLGQLKALLKNDETGLQKLKNSDFGGTEPRSLSENNSANRDSGQNRENILVAVAGGHIIPYVDRLKLQINHGNRTGNIEGIENLILRLGKMISERDFNIQDVLRFLELSDLPITNNGNIVVYKAVGNIQGGANQTQFGLDSQCYIDKYSQTIHQWVGCMVQVPEDYVEANRDVDCAQGLHVARRSYLRGYRGRTCLLCILKPEDIIVVPTYDASKVRVKSYQIIDTLTDQEYAQLMDNQPFVIKDDPESQAKLDRAINDQYGEPTHLVTRSYSGITYESLGSEPVKPTPEVKTKAVHIEETMDNLNPKEGGTITVSKANHKYKYTKEEMHNLLPVTNKNDALLLNAWRIHHKQSWTYLEVPDDQVAKIEEFLED